MTEVAAAAPKEARTETLALLAPPSIFSPCSIYECWDLLRSSIGRDNWLLKEYESRNSVSVGDVITGIGTEDPRELSLRQSAALGSLPLFLDEFTGRNVRMLGPGLIKALLCLETEADDDGIPIEHAEDAVNAIVGKVLVAVQSKVRDDRFVQKMLEELVSDGEVLFYCKYKLLKSVRSSLDSSQLRVDKIVAGLDSSSLSAYGSRAISPAELKRKYFISVNRCMDNQFSKAINLSNPNPFTHELLLVELLETKLALFAKSQNDVDLLLPFISELVWYLKKKENLTPHLVNAFMRLLLASRDVLLEVVEDPSLTRQLKVVLALITAAASSFDTVVVDTARSVLSCLDVS